MAASTCARCHQPLPENARFCSNCGAGVVAPQVAAPLPPLGPPGPPLCKKCGLIAPTEQSFCSVCDAAFDAHRPDAPGMPGDLLWAGLEVRFECRACRQYSPLNHLDVDGQVKCLQCGVEQRFEVERWKEVIDFAHAVADLAGPVASRRSPGSPPIVGNLFDGVGRTAAFSEAQMGAGGATLKVRAGPGHPLCEQCSIPLSIIGCTPSELTVVCPTCRTQRAYQFPQQAQGRFSVLRGVLGAEHEVGRRDVKTEEGAGGSVVVRCGNCTAPLQIPEGTSITTCTYCNTACRITPDAMWRTGSKSLRAHWWWLLLEGPSSLRGQLAPAEVSVPRPPAAVPDLAPTPRKTGGCLLALPLVALGVAVLAVGIGGYVLTQEGGEILDTKSPGSPLSNAMWNGVRPALVYDVNGDGVLDVVGSLRTVTPQDTIRLAALDGRNGKLLWRTDVVGTYTEAGTDPLQIAGDLVLLYQEGGRLSAFKVSDGSPRFNIRLNENIEGFCGAPEKGQIVVATRDKQHHTLSLADGGIKKAEPAGECAPVDPKASGLVFQDRFGVGGLEVREIKGMQVREIATQAESGLMLALGAKEPGTRIPRLAVFRWHQATEELEKLDREYAAMPERMRSEGMKRMFERRRKMAMAKGTAELSWSADVPGVDPLSASEGDLDKDKVALNGDTLVAVYGLKRSAHLFRLTAFSFKTGKRHWDVEIDDDSPFSGVTATPTHVFVSRWNGLFAFDLKTGELTFEVK